MTEVLKRAFRKEERDKFRRAFQCYVHRFVEQDPHPGHLIPYRHIVAVLADHDEVVLDLVFCSAILSIFRNRQYKLAVSRNATRLKG